MKSGGDLAGSGQQMLLSNRHKFPLEDDEDSTQPIPGHAAIMLSTCQDLTQKNIVINISKP